MLLLGRSSYLNRPLSLLAPFLALPSAVGSTGVLAVAALPPLHSSRFRLLLALPLRRAQEEEEPP